MRTLLSLFLFLRCIQVLAAPVVKPNVAENLLRAKLAETFPDASRTEIVSFFMRGTLPENAILVGMHPEIPMGQVQVEYSWSEKGQVRQSLATAVIKVYSKVLVAHSDIQMNEPFTAANTRTEEKEVSKLRVSGFYTDLNELSEFRARGFIPHGSVIGNLQTAKPVLVNAGQMIDLIYSKSRVRISAKVKALERGVLNQWIRVENPTTKRVIQGRVLDYGQASVQ